MREFFFFFTLSGVGVVGKEAFSFLTYLVKERVPRDNHDNNLKKACKNLYGPFCTVHVSHNGTGASWR